MAGDIYVVAEHLNGKLAEVSLEMLGKGRELASALGGKLNAIVLGKDAKGAAEACGAPDAALYVEHEALAGVNPDTPARLVPAIPKERVPAVLIVSNTSQGMELA